MTVESTDRPDFLATRPGPRDYQASRWNDPLVFELHSPGSRGVMVPLAPSSLLDAMETAPEAAVRRPARPRLPEINQPQVLRHFLRLSQETLGAHLNVDIGQGTCTMKYSPVVNELFANSPFSVDLHPLQPAETVQGTLKILAELEGFIREISGMDAVSLQPAAGSAAIHCNVRIVQAYHRHRGESATRDEIVTTIFSHPSNAATAKTAGYKVITLHPGEDGLVALEDLRSALSDRTAALMITNPEDTGIFNPRIAEFVEEVHRVGALTIYDQANANGILGVTRAREAGFDLCHFNLHKTFSTPHACGGPAAAAIGAVADLEPFLPGPRVVRTPEGYRLQARGELAIAPSRPFYGVIPNLMRAYAWIRSLGATGLREVAETAVLNNNYVRSCLSGIPGVSESFAGYGHTPIGEVRYSWEELHDATGVRSGELGQRMADFGMHYWTGHHPYLVPEPATIEPTESYSQAELDEYVAALREVAREAHEDPSLVRTAPHRSSIHRVDGDAYNDPPTWLTSWRAYRRKVLGEQIEVPEHWVAPEDLPMRPRPPKALHR